MHLRKRACTVLKWPFLKPQVEVQRRKAKSATQSSNSVGMDAPGFNAGSGIGVVY